MSLTPGEIGAIVVGLLIGYWAIGAVLLWLRPKATGKPRTEFNDSSAKPKADAQPAWNEVLGIHPSATPQEIRDASIAPK